MRNPVITAFIISFLPCSFAADIYASIGKDGSTRWATQSLDSTYEKVIAEPIAQVTSETTFVPISPKSLLKPSLIPRVVELRRLVHKTALHYALDPHLMMAMVEAESGFNTKAISPKGARGLMQLMPATAARYGMRNVQELHEPARNLEMGAHHVKDLLALHGGNWALAIAAYNAGQGAVAKHGQRIPRYAETMLYVPTVLALAARNALESE
jgi:soluble lytic murein transglycosylase-like protein